jgi:hypothetical protein
MQLCRKTTPKNNNRTYGRHAFEFLQEYDVRDVIFNLQIKSGYISEYPGISAPSQRILRLIWARRDWWEGPPGSQQFRPVIIFDSSPI